MKELHDLEAVAADLFARHPDLGGVYVGCARVFQIGAVMQRLGVRVPCVGFQQHRRSQAAFEWRMGLRRGGRERSPAGIHGLTACLRGRHRRLTWVRGRNGCAFPPPSSSAPTPSIVSVANRSTTLSDSSSASARLSSAPTRTSSKTQTLKLLRLAETDALTGLLNRRKFEELVDEQITAATPHAVLSLLMLDLDSFKSYNDSYGHHVGDEALAHGCARPRILLPDRRLLRPLGWRRVLRPAPRTPIRKPPAR